MLFYSNWPVWGMRSKIRDYFVLLAATVRVALATTEVHRQRLGRLGSYFVMYTAYRKSPSRFNTWLL